MQNIESKVPNRVQGRVDQVRVAHFINSNFNLHILDEYFREEDSPISLASQQTESFQFQSTKHSFFQLFSTLFM